MLFLSIIFTKLINRVQERVIFFISTRKEISLTVRIKDSYTVLIMAINIVMKLITMIMVLELIVISAATTHNNSSYDEVDSFSPTCILECTALCKGKGWMTPICMAKCLFNCKDSATVSDDVHVCTSTCAQSNCSIFVDSGN